MDPRRPSLDLARELTCSICTELLYQPLTILDCLHTFCGACLKEWFGFQKERIERSPSPPAPDDVLFTCPSCRASVRDTKHNATVVTLLDMYTTAKPHKGRSDLDKQEMSAKYRPGDHVIPHVTTRERTAYDRRAQEEDRRLMQQVREMSLREPESAPPVSTSLTRPRRESRATTEERLSSRRTRDHGRSRRNPAQLGLITDGHQPPSSESQQRQVGHQSSIRSLISSADLSEREIEREIEDFARQIQEEGLLEGLDLDNIDLARDDELSRRITQAYRRRQRSRTMNHPTRRDSSTLRAQQTLRDTDNLLEPRPRPLQLNSPTRSPEGSRPALGSLQMEDRHRRSSHSATNLQVHEPQTEPRRRAASGSRAVTTPAGPTEPPVWPAIRSQTDMNIQTHRNTSSTLRPNTTSHARSSSVPPALIRRSGASVPASSSSSSFSNRLARSPARNATDSRKNSMASSRDRSATRHNRAFELSIVHSAATSPVATSTVQSEIQRSMSQLYSEPFITCSRCNKPHIEYEIHYNCSICAGGHWSICSDCYRSGKGCLYWFGFGHGGWIKWKRRQQRRGDDSLAPPHVLTASRYQPSQSRPGGADGRKTLTMDDPQLRLETGTFCARCQVWTRECYWRCDICNDGEWGYCNNCVNQGRSCTHPLLPLIHEVSQPHSSSSGRPTAARIVTESPNRSISSLKPLSFATTCDICRGTITPSDTRYHCYSCTSSLVDNAAPGDYDICSPCYAQLVSGDQISQENGHSGWRRCLQGHRMAVIGFAAGEAGQWRYIKRDLVGGRKLRVEPLGDDDQSSQSLQKWSWKQDDEKLERPVTLTVSSTVPSSSRDSSSTYTSLFPPDGGTGLRVFAKWAWYPREDADDELLFPRGAEIREAEDVNGDWFHGVYMGARGLFPSNYVGREGDDDGSQ